MATTNSNSYMIQLMTACSKALDTGKTVTGQIGLTATGTDSVATLCYMLSQTLGVTSSVDIDLAGALTNIYGEAQVFSKVYGLIIQNKSTANVINVGAAAANPWYSWLGGATDKVVLRPGGVMALIAPDTTQYAVTAGTGDILTVTEASTNSGCSFWLYVLGS